MESAARNSTMPSRRLGCDSGAATARGAILLVAVLLVADVAAAQPSPQLPAAQPAAKQAAPKAPARAAVPAFKLVVESKATELLKAASARLAAAKSMSFTAIVGYEYPSKLGPPIVYTSRYDVTMQRPDRLKVVNSGDGPASEFYYDGRAMMAYAPAANLVAVADAPPTIGGALDAAYQSAAIYFPFEPLLAADPYAALTAGTFLAFYVGPSGIVGGTRTDILAWANDDVFVQIWIGADDKLPRRVRAIYRRDPYSLRHEMELSNWQLDGAFPPDAFVSQKAQSGQRIAFASPAGAPSPGMKPPTKAKPASAQAKSK